MIAKRGRQPKYRKKLKTFENRVQRKISGHTIDGTRVNWRRRHNKELNDMLKLAPVTSFLKGQWIQCLGYITRSGRAETVKATIEWKPQKKETQRQTKKKVDGHGRWRPYEWKTEERQYRIDNDGEE